MDHGSRSGSKAKTENGVSHVSSDHPDEGTAQLLQTYALGIATVEELNMVVKEVVNLTHREGTTDQIAMNEMLAMIVGIGPTNTVETMLAIQMAAIHRATINSAVKLRDSSALDVAAYRAKTLNNLSRTFATQAETLKKLRSSGEQKVVVEHKHYHLAAGAIADGAQAVLGDVTGGTGGLIEKGGQSHERMLLSERAAMLGTLETDALPVQGASPEGQASVPFPRRASRGAIRAA